MTQTRIYLDYAATSPLHPEALAAMLPYLEGPTYNASSLHREGRRAKAALEEARERIARVLGAKRKEVLFFGGGSEADALALIGMARAQAGRHIVASAIEHHAILRSLDLLREEGYEITLLGVDERGFVDPERFAAALRDETALACVMYANNEIGTIQPIARLAGIAHSRGIAFHTDAIAAGSWLPLEVAALEVDAMVLAAHKFGGPKGVGVLYLREGTPMAPILRGGGQEFGKRAGTEDVAGAVGSAAALEVAQAQLERNAARVAALRDRLESGIPASVPSVRLNGGMPRLPGLSNLSFAGVTAEALAVRLDLEGIAASPGSACTSGVAESSHVVAALGTGDPREAIRFSLGPSTTQEEIDRVLQVMPSAISELRRT